MLLAHTSVPPNPMPTERRRRGRPATGSFTDYLARIRSTEGRAWSAAELAVLTGLSKRKILDDINVYRDPVTGLPVLAAFPVPTGSRFQFYIAHVEARRYARALGVVVDERS